MKKQISLIVSLILALGTVPAVRAAPAEIPRIVVRYKTESWRQAAKSESGLLAGRNIHVVKPADAAEYIRWMEDFAADPSVAFAEPVVRYSPMVVPPDPHLDFNWGHQAVGVYEAWDICTGSPDVTVAVIDTGVDLNDPDLVANLIPGYDFVNRDNAPDNTDGSLHGTLVSKIIGAEAGNMVEGEAWGTAGMAWNCRIMPLQVFDGNNLLESGNSDIIAEAVYHAVDSGADIVNMSLGGPEPSMVVEEAVRYAREAGVLVVASSGNSGTEVMYPADWEDAMAVGAFGEQGLVETYSCRGDTLSLTAPGRILMEWDGSKAIYADGTSFAAPYVAGAAVLIKTLHPQWSPEEIRWALEKGAEDAGEEGWDCLYGNGRLSVFAALSESLPPAVDGNDGTDQKIMLTPGENQGILQIPLDRDYYGLALDETTTVKINCSTSVPISLTGGVERWPAGERTFEIKALNGRWSPDPYTIEMEIVPYGDFDGSRRVDIYDLAALAKRSGTQTGTAPGDSIWDADLDGWLDANDLSEAAARYGETY